MVKKIAIVLLIFFMWSPLVRRHLSDHFLWSIFQPSLNILHITNHAGPSVWAAAAIHVLHLWKLHHKPEDPVFCYVNSYKIFLSLNDWYTILWRSFISTVVEWHFFWSRRSTTKPIRLDLCYKLNKKIKVSFLCHYRMISIYGKYNFGN